ncbi:uncharacterized protein [Anabrus simplex]|uniref:uncharacterized protein n=1 Tax=Anabrus simplex TaxID=316456 RepID=UPI0035A2CB78
MSPVKSFATVVLFIPHNSTSLYSLKTARHAMNNFRKNSPDITLLFLTSGNLDTYELLVDNMNDVYTYSNIRKMNTEPIITRLKQVPRRITNPCCVPILSGIDYKTYKYNQVVDYGGINYYRLHPRYLFPAGAIRIRVQEKRGILEVCFSRRSAQPHKTSEATECRTTTGPMSEVSLNITEACIGLEDVHQCPPLYISVQSRDARPSYQCTKDPDCRSSDDVLYTVSFTGITCGAGHFLTFSFTLILEAVLMTLSRTFYQN